MSLAKIERYLENGGWKRSVAGDADFDAALLAVEELVTNGKGLVASGEYGVGKTVLASLVAEAFGPVYKVRLALPDDIERLDARWQEYHAETPYRANVFLDDLGAESPVNEYGVKMELVGDFIVQFHERRMPQARLFITTNLTTAEIDQRYGGRVLSRLKDLCVPLRLNGKDKRKWSLGGQR